MTDPARAAARTKPPSAPSLAVGLSGAKWLTEAGEVQTLSLDETARRVRSGVRPYVCHHRAVARRLGLTLFPSYDVLELFAFVRPARFCVPTANGLASALALPPVDGLETEASSLPLIARSLLAELTASPGDSAGPIALAMLAGGWPWAETVLSAVGAEGAPFGARRFDGLKVWMRIAEWEDRAKTTPSDSWPVEPVEARARLVKLLGPKAEPRPQQMTYTSHAAGAFLPRDAVGEPRIVLCEAGTGIGKTLGYLAPSSVWAQKNRGSVWVSTYTRNLQRQIDRELNRVYPDFRDKSDKVVVRKGRENIFCLLNFESAVLPLTSQTRAEDAVVLGLVARWAASTRDGDMSGGDFPAWLTDLLGPRLTVGLTDTRGECIYSACPHFQRCFIEKSVRRARHAEIVVANHALVMIHAARGGDEHGAPLRYVFDEAHHVFDAADNAFSLSLSGLETSELRRWLRGAEGSQRSRSRGLRNRVGEILADDRNGQDALDALVHASACLPKPGWRRRLLAGTPVGPAEEFLAVVREQIYARNADHNNGYSLETATHPPVPRLIEAAHGLDEALEQFEKPLKALIRALGDKLNTDASRLEDGTRARIEGIRRSLTRRTLEPIAGWRAMLATLLTETPSQFVDWLAIDRSGDQEIDVGLHRHWLDPTQPFARVVLNPAHGALLTSASMRDSTGDDEADWEGAEARTGVRHLDAPPVLSSLASPFDYGQQTKVLVVTDVRRDDLAQVAAAYRELFMAAGGGALGLFTAIVRLRAVFEAIAPKLEAAGLRLMAQHIDVMDLGSLIDIFREESSSCLLGTDAVRDGVDVPGGSLRLIVFDRVPWPRPTILHRARRDAFGGRAYDEMLVRLKLKQAFGRLVRRADDLGVFVLLDRQFPSRLSNAFPGDITVTRLGLRDAISMTRDHLGT